jgi:hypothetical protein
MMKKIASFLLALSITLACSSAASALTTPPNSEIEGVIVKVVPSEREIYVESEGKKHEYYFNPMTKVVRGNEEKKYEDLQKGMRVKVSANKIGKRLDPFEVRILE